MDQPTLTVFAEFRAKSGKAEELKRLLGTLLEPTRKERGCVQYDLHADNDQAGHFLFFENWTSMAELNAHLKSPHLTSVLAQTTELVEEPARVVLASKIG